MRGIYFSMVKTKYKTTEDTIIELESLKGEKKLKFHQNIGDYHDPMKNMWQNNTF